MIIYILKLSACLLVFWLLYVLLLEKQSTHLFKRFYLLGTLLASAIIPLMSITTYIDPISIAETPQTLYIQAGSEMELTESEAEPFIELSTLFWSIYLIGAVFFGLRFSINLTRLIRKIRSHEQFKSPPFIYVLLNKALPPHSFFNYLFFNKEDYDSQGIPKEVLIHEQTHARQLHSLDIMLIELLQIVLWFHPLIYLIKNHIKLNHEFLADRAVLNQGVNSKSYQNILLDYLSHPQTHQLSSSINYSSIKKRMTVMKTKTSKKRSLFTSLLMIPVVSLLVYNVADHQIKIKEPSFKNHDHKVNTIPAIEIEIRPDGSLILNQEPIAFEDVAKKAQQLTGHLSKEAKQTYVYASIQIPDPSYTSISNQLIDELRKIDIISAITGYSNNQLQASSSYKHFSPFAGKTVSEAKAFKAQMNSEIARQTEKEDAPWNVTYGVSQVKFTAQNDQDTLLKKYNETTKHYTDAIRDYLNEPGGDNSELVRQYKHAYKLYESFSETAKARHGIKMPPPPPAQKTTTQQGATKAQIAEYNSWAKGLNAQAIADRIVKLKDYEYYRAIYKQMNKSQKESAEPFPALPPPPKPHDGYLKNYNAWASKMSEEIKKAESDEQYPYPIIKQSDVFKYRNIYNNKLSNEERKQALPFPKIPPPPPPPPPAPKEPEIKKYVEVKLPSSPPKQPYAQNSNNKVIIGQDAYSETPKISGLPAANGTSYLIKNIIVTGNSEFNDNTIITFSNLNKGEIIAVGGKKIKSAVSRLWSSNLFKSIDIYLVNTDGDKTDVEIRVIDRPKDEELKTQPPPPPPKPIEHIKDLAEQGAFFYFEGNEITSNEAIKIISDRKGYNISVKENGAQEPKVFISKNSLTQQKKN